MFVFKPVISGPAYTKTLAKKYYESLDSLLVSELVEI
jgi:hypothetical protein